MKPSKEQVAEQFDRMSHAYAQSDGHARGDDLRILVEYLRPTAEMRVLDVATGAGHTAAAVAPFVREVIAADIAPAMLDRTNELAAARGLSNLKTILAEAESLAFPDASFDAVTCRIAPHHFQSVDIVLSEIARVLKPGGAFVLEDNVAPEDPELDRFLNAVEKIRDVTHVRSLRPSEWRAKLAFTGLLPVKSIMYRKTIDIAPWIARAGVESAQAQRVYEFFAQAPEKAVKYFALEYSGGRAARYTDDKIIVRAERVRVG